MQQDFCYEIVNRLIANNLVVVQNQNKLFFDGCQIIEQRTRNRAGWWQSHPAQGGEELSSITPDSAHQRDFERGFYGGVEGARAFEAAGVKRVGMRPLRDLLRS